MVDSVHAKRRGIRERAPNARGDYDPKRTYGMAVRILQVAKEEVAGLNPRIRLAQGLANRFPQSSFNRIRTQILRAGRFKIGQGTLILGDVYISGEGDWPSLFSIGENTVIAGPLRINLGGAVRVGSNVRIEHDVMLLAVDHQIGPPWRRAGWSEHAEVVIQDGAWIGPGATVLPGVVVGAGAIVAAGAVVAADVAPRTHVAGVPARAVDQPESNRGG